MGLLPGGGRIRLAVHQGATALIIFHASCLKAELCDRSGRATDTAADPESIGTVRSVERERAQGKEPCH